MNSNALGIIDECYNWYSNQLIDDFHKRVNLNKKKFELSRMNFAKRCCADDANLCEIISVSPEKEETAQQFINEFLKNNNFDVRYREQLEKTSATGTVGAYLYLNKSEYIKDGNAVMAKGGNILINYCDADCIIPLTVENKLVTECAFSATNTVKGKERTTLVIFTKNKVGVKFLYKADTIVFDESGGRLDSESFSLQLGEIKPFSVMINAEVNNIENMEGYGLPKIYNSIPLFKAVDLCYSILYGDLDKGEKIVFINEMLSCLKINKNGEAELTSQQKD